MTRVTPTTLKTYFNANDAPTEAQMVNLIDSTARIRYGALVQQTAAQTLTSGVGAALTYSATPVYADTGFDSTVTSIFPSTGSTVTRVRAHGQVTVSTAASGSLTAELKIDGAAFIPTIFGETPLASSNNTVVQLASYDTNINIGQNISIVVTQDSGGDLDTIAGQSWLMVEAIDG